MRRAHEAVSMLSLGLISAGCSIYATLVEGRKSRSKSRHKYSTEKLCVSTFILRLLQYLVFIPYSGKF